MVHNIFLGKLLRLLIFYVAGHDSLIKALVKAGASVNIRDGGGWTPLHVAIAIGPTPSSHTLISAGADVNLRGPEG